MEVLMLMEEKVMLLRYTEVQSLIKRLSGRNATNPTIPTKAAAARHGEMTKDPAAMVAIQFSLPAK